MGNAGLKQHYETASKTGVLQISDNKLKEIPAEVFTLSDNLRNLDLSKNKLSALPDTIKNFKNLKHFNVESNKLSHLPEVIGNLIKLEYLNCSHNIITTLPQSLNMLSHLKQIYLNSNKLTKFPDQLIGLKNLEVVELSNNKIIEVPKGMDDFHATELNLTQNEISNLSEDLHQAPKLKILRLEENCLVLDSIRTSLLRDSKIHTLNLEGNLFEMKQLAMLEGYNEYIEKYTAVKKKMF